MREFSPTELDRSGSTQFRSHSGQKKMNKREMKLKVAAKSLFSFSSAYPIGKSKCACCQHMTFLFVCFSRSRGFTFTWWGCCGLCRRHKQPSLPTPFHSGLVFVSVFMALSTVFHFINSLDKSPHSHSVFSGLISALSSFQLFISL